MNANGGRCFGPVWILFTLSVLLLWLRPDMAAAGTCSLNCGLCPPYQGPAACGDPINLVFGNVFEEETDYETTGENKLSLKRAYNSIGGFGSFGNWVSIYDRSLSLNNSNGRVLYTIAARPDGKFINFFPDGNGGWTGISNLDLRLNQSGATYILTDWNDTVETYNAISQFKAQLVSIRARNGYTQTMGYNGAGQLTSVTDSYGRILNFTYSGPWISQATTPDGLVVTYNYGSGQLTGALLSAGYSTSPATTRSYLYETCTSVCFSPLLTGVIDQNGNQFSTWTYEDPAHTAGCAVGNQRPGGVGLVTVSYGNATTCSSPTTVTNALGQAEVYKTKFIQVGPSDSFTVITEIDRQATPTTAAAKRLFTWDANGYLASETDWNGNLTTYVNDARGQPTTITEAAGTPQQRVTTVTYHANFHLPAQIVGPRTTTTFTYDANGELLTLAETDNTVRSDPYSTQGQARTWTFTWANSLLASAKSPRTAIPQPTRFGYDANGALTSVTDPLGHVTQVTQHSAGGLPQTIVDPNGVTTTLTYDARQRLTASSLMSLAGPLTTSFAYDAAGNLIGKTLPDGSALTYQYDAAHRLTGIADLSNNRVAYTLDALGDRTQIAYLDPQNHTTRSRSASFDALGRKLQEVGGAGQVTTSSYDSNGNLLTTTDGRGLVTTQSYDALNRLIQMVEPNGGVTLLTYNQLDQVNNVTDPNGNKTTYVYDGFGDLIEDVSPDRGATVYTYNAGALLTQRSDAAGAVVSHVYEGLDRVASTTYPNHSAENVAFTYDQGAHGVGHLTTLTDAAGSASFSYNLRGLLTQATRTLGSASISTAYTYDRAQRLSTITYPSRLAVSYGRDAMGRITTITATPKNGTAQTVVSNIAYQPFGPIASFSYGDGVVENRGYDLDYRQTTLAALPVQSLSYGYDGNDNVLSIADGVNSGKNQSFSYSPLNRLNAANGGYGGLAYKYDLVGNRLSAATTVGATTTTQTYFYAAGTDRLTQISIAGNVQRQFAYTPTGNIAQDNRGGGGLFTLGYNQDNRLASFADTTHTLAGYTYDAFGQRLIKTLSTGVTILYQYDLFGHLIEEDDISSGTAVPVVDYLYLGDQPIGLYLPATGLFFYHDDRLGTPQLVTDKNQGVFWRGDYQPFGPVTVTASLTQNLRMSGQYLDNEIGWAHNGFRTYAQGLGRYIESDPVGLAGGLDTYAYAGSNPAAFTDPTGLDLQPGLFYPNGATRDPSNYFIPKGEPNPTPKNPDQTDKTKTPEQMAQEELQRKDEAVRRAEEALERAREAAERARKKLRDLCKPQAGRR